MEAAAFRAVASRAAVTVARVTAARTVAAVPQGCCNNGATTLGCSRHHLKSPPEGASHLRCALRSSHASMSRSAARSRSSCHASVSV
eukprot:7388246-Prymnesium_polylepis.1